MIFVIIELHQWNSRSIHQPVSSERPSHHYNVHGAIGSTIHSRIPMEQRITSIYSEAMEHKSHQYQHTVSIL